MYEHVNNANYWAAVEEWLGGPGAGRRIVGATIEYGGGLAPDESCEVAVAVDDTEVTFWFLVGVETRAAARVHLAPS